jgi:hypothetical protein
MDVEGARKFRVSIRVLVPTIVVCALLVVSAIWNIQLHRRAEEQRQRAITAERAEAARVEAERLRAIAIEKADAERERDLAKKRAVRAEDVARMRQLYDELNILSQMSDRIQMENRKLNLPAKETAQPDQAVNDPAVTRTGIPTGSTADPRP